ncbi:MAG: MBL fold metallo-hydrolase [Anaerolineales bacterium]
MFVEDRYQPYNVGLIILKEGALVVDSPPRPADARSWLREAQEVGGVIRYLVVTDAQPDHLLGAVNFDAVPLVAAEETARFLNELEDKEWQELLQEAQGRYPDAADELAKVKRRKVTFSTNCRMYLQRRNPPLELEVGAGAGPGSLWLFVPDEKVLFAGDTVALNTPPVMERTPDSKEWLNALGALANRISIQRIVPGRGPAVILRGELEPEREYLRVMRRTARTLARKGNAGEGLAQATNDIQQTFFPDANKKSEKVQRIRRGLQRLVEEVLESQAAEQDEED